MIGLVGGDAIRCLNALDSPDGCGFGPHCRDCVIRRATLDTFTDHTNREGLETWLPFPSPEGIEERCLRVSTAYLVIDNQDQVLVCIQDITEHRKAEESYQTLFHEALEGFALHEIICDGEGHPADYTFLAVNPAYERMTGMSKETLIGRTGKEVFPGLEQHWMDLYGMVALTGKPAVFEDYSERMNKHFEVRAFSPAPGKFACSLIDITDRVNTADSLRSSIAERDVLLREIHHRVKNNLNVILGLLNVQASSIQTPEKAIEAFQRSRDRIMAMALVHEELYTSHDYTRIHMDEYVNNLVRSLQVIYDPEQTIGLRMDISDVSFPVDTAVPCGLILNELITNAYTHAFDNTDSATVFISFRTTGSDVFEIIVSDNGVGLPKNSDVRGSLGLTLVGLLTEQINGSLNRTTGQGTTFSIQFRVTPGT
jgi:PAS domain S-box-containing protein